MGLNDLVDQPEYPVGSVSSRMKPKNVEANEEFWETIAVHHPHMLHFAADYNTKRSQIKLFIELLDRVIQNEVSGIKASDSQKREAENVREDLVDYL